MSGPPEVRYIEQEFAMVTDPNMVRLEVQEYCKFHLNCCQSYKQSEATENMIPRFAELGAVLRTRAIEQVRASAILGNAEDCLDLAIRCVYCAEFLAFLV